MQVKNYTAHAIKSLDQVCLSASKKGLFEDAKFLGGLKSKMLSSVTFALPDYGKVFDTGFRGLQDAALHLPFPCVTLEYAVPEKHEHVLSGKLAYSPKRVIVAVEISTEERSLEWLPAGVARSVRAALVEQDGEGASGILVCSVSAIEHPYKAGEILFMPEMAGWVLPAKYPEAVELQSMIAETLGLEGYDNGGVVMGRVIILMEEACARGVIGWAENRVKAMIDGLGRDIGQEAGAVLEFIEACSCSNVSHQVIQAAPKASVVQRRARDGKLPLLETRALVLDLPGRTKTAIGGQSGGDSGRSSPRQHLRRGHIRRLESGKRVWVQSAVIGAERSGVIEKSYAVRARQA